MCAWVLTIALTLSLWRPSSSRMRLTSSPGSTTNASRVTGSPMIEQLHCNIPTGIEMCRNPCFSTPTAGVRSSIEGSITSVSRGIAPQNNVWPAFCGGHPSESGALLHYKGGSRRGSMQSPETAKILETPLALIHEQGGAKMGTWFGCALPDDFGDWEREYWFAHKSVALIDKTYRSYLNVTGPDRVRYLNAILTNNIKDLAPSHGNVSLLLSPQGRILAELETYALPESLFCVSYAMVREQLIETIEKFIIMDDVTVADDTQKLGTLALEGPAAAAIVSELTGIDLNSIAELQRHDASIGAIPCTVIRRSPGKIVGAEIIAERQHMEALWHTLQEKAKAAGGGAVGYSALSAIRLEQGVPWFSYDFGEKQIPHEAVLEKSHISYTKGCYTGQEIVERVRSRGQVNRVRALFKLSGDAVPSAGEILTSDGKEAG